MNNRGLLLVIALILVGILGILGLQYHERQKSPMEKVGDGISEALDDAGDEIEKATDGR